MPKKNWARLGVQITWLGIIITMVIAIFSLVSDKTDRYFSLIAVALFGYIVYAEWLKK